MLLPSFIMHFQDVDESVEFEFSFDGICVRCTYEEFRAAMLPRVYAESVDQAKQLIERSK